MSPKRAAESRQKALHRLVQLADCAIFGTLSETYRTCGRKACRCYGDGPKHGPHLHISYRGAEGRTSGYYVRKAAQATVRNGVAAWAEIHEILRQIAEENAQQAMEAARSPKPSPARNRRRNQDSKTMTIRRSS